MSIEGTIKGTAKDIGQLSAEEAAPTETAGAKVAVFGAGSDMKFDAAQAVNSGAKLQTLDELHEKDLRDAKAFADWPFVELSNNYNMIRESKSELESTKKAMDEASAKKMDPNSVKLAQMNILKATGMEGSSVAAFDAKYQELHQDAERLDALLRSFVSYYAPYAKSVQFLSNSMVETCQQRQKELNAQDGRTNREYLTKRMDNIIAAYSDRTNFEPLFNKLSYGHVILEHVKDFTAKGPEEAIKYINQIFLSTYRDKNMSAFRSRMASMVMLANQQTPEEGKEVEISDNMKVDLLFVTYWLAKVYEAEFNSGKCSYIKTFIMNTYDTSVQSGMNFDIKGGITLHALTVRVVYTLLSWVLASFTNGTTAKQIRADYQPRIYNPIMDEYRIMAEEAIKLNPGVEMPTDTRFSVMFPDISIENICEDTDHVRREIAKGPVEDEGDPEEEPGELPEGETLPTADEKPKVPTDVTEPQGGPVS